MSALEFTSIADIEGIYNGLHTTYRSGKLFPLDTRRKQLYQLARLAQDNLSAIEAALHVDLGKPPLEAAGEVASIVRNSLQAAEQLEEWAAPVKPTLQGPMSSWDAAICPVPKGVVLIIAPWNYPMSLSFSPLIGAIAAGCPAVLKPSEHTPTCATLIAQLVSQYLDPEAYIVVNGAVVETTTLLTHRWDHIFFTGGGNIGRIVAAAAGEKLTPLTLELGGKNPVIVAEDCDVELAAKRILWAKTQNAGQLCVTADHVFVVRSVAPAFYEALLSAYRRFFPKSPFDPEVQWSKIVSLAHYARIKDLLDRTKGTVIAGGEMDVDTRQIAPTIVAEVPVDDSLMEEEIFGPILPVLEVNRIEEAIKHISMQSSPLAIYAFTHSEDLKHQLMAKTRSGAVVYNDVFTQLRVQGLPFGGSGESGYGTYFGKASFDTFSHYRNVVNIPPSAEPMFLSRYRPYSEDAYAAMKGAVQVKIPDV
ncbi:hypothetical protein EIP91_006948 [Steccherinum ochraceum]|uniref:Aldehyde dehydrogenase n=1 Tax=Steccherinum ochraceum TaxID=92696 RepID=A0A4R0RJB6_9APHY|nr:hypothetical protein EIP91_006948 [Steccherinum ochraceum]